MAKTNGNQAFKTKVKPLGAGSFKNIDDKEYQKSMLKRHGPNTIYNADYIQLD